MGLHVAEISGLAALRPIQSGARATAVPGAENYAAATDTGHVTPRASVARSAATAEGADYADDAAADTGCVTPRASGSMTPIAPVQQDLDAEVIGFATPQATGGEIGPRDGCGGGDTAGDESSFTTPTTADSALMPATVCPPAPRKSALAPTRKRAPLQQRLFYPVPRDLTTVFVAVPQFPPPAKRMRAHVVDASVPLRT